MPIYDGKLWMKRSNGLSDSVYVINWTGESFKDESEMKKRLKEYNEKKWMCRHMGRDINNVQLYSLKEALRIEKNALDEIRKRIPRDLLVEVCNIVHHCFSSKQSLLEKIRSRLDGYFFKDESVSFKHLDREYKGTIRKRICADGTSASVCDNDKENELKYVIEINKEDGNNKVMIKNVDSASIKREYTLSEQQLDDLVSLIAFKRNDNNAAWIVDDQFRESFNIPNKIHSLFTSHKIVHPATQTKSYTNLIQIRSGGGVDVENADGVKKKKVKQRDSSVGKSIKDDIPRPKRKKDASAGQGSTSINVHQRSLTNFLVNISSPTKPPNTSTIQSHPSAINSRKIEATLRKLLNALLNNDIKSFHTTTQIAAKSLSFNSIQLIDNDIIRFAIIKQYHSLIDHNAMKKMSNDEKKIYKEKKKNERKDEYSKMETKLHWLLNKKVEDTLIDHKNLLPVYDRIELGANQSAHQFTDCLVLSEFLNCFKLMLRPDCIPSADDLLNALYNGREGFFNVTAHILIAFLKLLFSDETGTKYSGCGTRLGMIAITFGTVSEMTRLIINGNENLRRNKGEEKSTCGECSHEQHPHLQQHGDILMIGNKLQEKAFFELNVDEQLEVLMFLKNRILETNTLSSFLSETITSEVVKLENQKQLKERKMMCLEVESNKLKMKLQLKDENMTRKQSLLLSKLEKQYHENVKKMERITETIHSITSEIQQLTTTRENAHRVKELGSDRFHQRYWFFDDSPNRGIFIEGNTDKHIDVPTTATTIIGDINNQQNGNNTSKKIRGKAKIQTIDAFINHQLTYTDEDVQKEWFLIRDENVLKQLMQSLSRNGYRESNLYSNIQSRFDQILSSFAHIPKANRSGDCEKMNEQELICDEIKTFYDQLRKSSLSTSCIENHSSDIESVRKWLLQIEDSLCARAFASFDRSQWRLHVHNAKSISRLHLLFYVLEKHINWYQSIEYKKCSSCNRQRNRDDLIICKQCSQAIHIHCIRPVITNKPEDGQFICQSCNQSNKADEESETESDESESERWIDKSESESSDTDYLYENEDDDEDDYEGPSKKKNKGTKDVTTALARNRNGTYKYFDTYTMVSADKRRARADPKQPKTPLQYELEGVFSKLESDIRIYNALITVPAVGRITLEKIKKQLYSYKSMSDFTKDLRLFINAALQHFHGNERKVNQLNELKSELHL